MHFTYAESPKNGELLQGDLLRRTSELDDVIETYHPYYSAKEDYTHFLILTQSCDLVRREGRPSGCRYISLATVRPLHVAIEREAAPYKQGLLLQKANAVSNKDKGRLKMFMARLLNNNEKDYFYLHEERQLGLSSSCAFLRLSISIRAEQHYKICQRARVVSLRSDFQAKLGWLVGNIFSRVGTEDWKPSALKKVIADSLEENIVWLDELKIGATKLNAEEINSMTDKEVIAQIESTPVVQKKEQVIGAILEELQAGKFIEAQNIEAMKMVLRAAPTVRAHFNK